MKRKVKVRKAKRSVKFAPWIDEKLSLPSARKGYEIQKALLVLEATMENIYSLGLRHGGAKR